MSSVNFRLRLFAASLVICLHCVSCSNNKNESAGMSPGNTGETVSDTTENGVRHHVSIARTSDGATVTDHYTVNATVSAVDKANRSVTLATSDNRQITFQAGEDARNFDQIAVGDRVTAQMWEQLAIHLRRGESATPERSEVTAAARSPKGDKPGGFAVNTVEETATVTALDPSTRQATLRFANGVSRTIQVGQNVDLSGVKAGDPVAVRHAVGASLQVQGK